MTKRLGIGAMLQELMGSLLFRKRATVLYPIERLEPPERFRGRLHYNVADCVLCGLCARDCPGNVIKRVKKTLTAEDGSTYEGWALEFEMDRCVFCGQCGESCRKGNITFSHDFELAQPNRQAFLPGLPEEEQE